MIQIQRAVEVERLRVSGRVNAEVHQQISEDLQPGVTTYELDQLARQVMDERACQSAFFGYEGFPAHICVSINNEIGHGIPTADRAISEGDVVKIDVGTIFDGAYSDCAKTYIVGAQNPEHLMRLVEVAEQALRNGIAQAEPGNRLSDVSYAIGSTVRAGGFHILKQAMGHGVGKALHEEPSIPNFGPNGLGPRLRAGMVLAIEPVVLSSKTTRFRHSNGWTDITSDGSVGAHFEHTILITEDGPEVLTQTNSFQSNQHALGQRNLEKWLSILKQTNPFDGQIEIRGMDHSDRQNIMTFVSKHMDPILIQAWGRRSRPQEIFDIPGTLPVVLQDGQGSIVGFCLLGPDRSAVHVNTLVISSTFHGSGMAAWVMQSVESFAKETGKSMMTLLVQSNNLRAIRFYEKLGFHYKGQAGINTFSMAKSVYSGT